MTFEALFKGSLIGIFAGILLGLYLKIIEAVTNQKVYTLLLNVDFIPIIGEITWPELIEFLFHLVVALILGVIFYYLARSWELDNRQRLYLAAALTLPALLLYFPLSLMAIKDVPSVTNWTAFFYWSTGHLVFAISMNKLFPFLEREKF